MQNYLVKLAQKHPELRVFSDDIETRISYPIATDHLIFMRTTEPKPRPIGELLEVVETTLGGKFRLPVETSPERALEPIGGRTSDCHMTGPVAAIEIWSIEPGCYDLVLKVPRTTAQSSTVGLPLINRFVDQAREISRLVDTTDLIRFHTGPSLTVREAQSQLSFLEKKTGTRLDSESLMQILEPQNKARLN
jgi:hypothetical protein